MTLFAAPRINCEVIDPRGEEVARIFNIQRYSLNDGRASGRSVFLKAVRIPALGVLTRNHSRHVLNWYGGRVNVCTVHPVWRDADECPSGAFERIGRDITLDDLEREVMKDEIFFRSSGGGVTLSGGESADGKRPLPHGSGSRSAALGCALCN